MPLFGGPPPGTHIAFACPQTRKLIDALVPNPRDGEIIGPDDGSHPAVDAPASTAGADRANADYAEWIKQSRATALDFCRTMLSASIGAIPVYFAMLKYLGFEKRGALELARLGVLPPFFFLAAALIFALAIRPIFVSITAEEFAAYRAARLGRLNKFMLGGLITFVVGIVGSIFVAMALL